MDQSDDAPPTTAAAKSSTGGGPKWAGVPDSAVAAGSKTGHGSPPFDPAKKNANRELAAAEAAKRSKKDCRVYVGNLSFGTKWNDLKDFMREGGSPLFRSLGLGLGCGLVGLGLGQGLGLGTGIRIGIGVGRRGPQRGTERGAVGSRGQKDTEAAHGPRHARRRGIESESLRGQPPSTSTRTRSHGQHQTLSTNPTFSRGRPWTRGRVGGIGGEERCSGAGSRVARPRDHGFREF